MYEQVHVLRIALILYVASRARTSLSDVAASRIFALTVVYCATFDYVRRWTRTGSWIRRSDVAVTAGETRPIPVGAGWSFFIQKSVPCGSFVMAPSGRIRPNVWGAGTTIRELQDHLTARGKTVASHPSIDDATLGGWIASGSHGSGGTLWKSAFDAIVVRDLDTGRRFEARPKELFGDDRTVAQCRRYLIEEVAVTPVDDCWCRKEAYKLRRVEDAQRFLATPSHLRMLQIGARGTMALLWTPATEDDMHLTHVDPHVGSQTGLWLQADVLSMFQSASVRDQEWFDFPVESPGAYVSRLKLSTANRFTPTPPTFLTWIGLFFVNFEVFIASAVTAAQLHGICEDLSTAFSDTTGRCELRAGTDKLFLDFVIHRGADAKRFVHLVSRRFPGKCRLHRGKALSEPPDAETDMTDMTLGAPKSNNGLAEGPNVTKKNMPYGQ